MQAVELLGALGAGLDPAGVLDGFGQQPGEVGVAQADSRFLEPGAHRVASMSPSALGEIVGRQEGRDVAVDDHAADGQAEVFEFLDGLDGLLDRQRLEQGNQMDRGLLGVQQLDHTIGLRMHRPTLGQV